MVEIVAEHPTEQDPHERIQVLICVNLTT